MAKISKNRKAVLAKYNLEKEYSLEEAAKMLKEISFNILDASSKEYSLSRLNFARTAFLFLEIFAIALIIYPKEGFLI
jgi:ribosomal protein L1